MTFLVHLSDLHMTRHNGAQALLFDKLIDTLKGECDRARPEQSTVVITGDVFDSGTDPPAALVDAFLKLHERMLATFGDLFTIVLPGNHDRRRFGLIGPNREALFRELHRAADPTRMHVLGQRTPFLAEVVPATLHRLPAHVVAYDSSYLPSGLFGAGGTFRLEDLLQVHAQLPNDGRPLLLLVHHHLIPTPVTDISHIDMVGTPRAVRWLVRRALPMIRGCVLQSAKPSAALAIVQSGRPVRRPGTRGGVVLLTQTQRATADASGSGASTARRFEMGSRTVWARSQ